MKQMKECTWCHKTKVVSEFYKSKYLKSGYRSECKECMNSKNKEWRESHKEEIKIKHKSYYERNWETLQKKRRQYIKTHKAELKAYRDTHKEQIKEWKLNNKERWKAYKKQYSRFYYLMKTYNITPEEYSQLEEQQNGKCAICGGGVEDSNDVYLCVDHNHITGKIRGLLCRECNLGLGNFKESIEILQKAVQYMQETENEKGT